MPGFVFYIAVVFASFVVGVLFSQKVKDWFSGVPATLRADLNAIEANVKAQVQGAQKQVVAQVSAAVVPPTPTPTPASPP